MIEIIMEMSSDDIAVVSFFVNIIYVVITFIIMTGAIIAIKQTSQLRKDNLVPSVGVSFETRQIGGLLCLVFKNYGNGVAYDIVVDVSEHFKRAIKGIDRGKLIEKFQKLMDNPFILSASQEVVFILGSPADFEILGNEELEIDIKYYDIHREEYTHKTMTGINGFGVFSSRGTEMDIIATAIERISKEVKNLNTKIKYSALYKMVNNHIISLRTTS